MPAGPVHLPALLRDALGVASRSEAAGSSPAAGVSVDGEPVGDLDVDAAALDGRVLRAGKRRFARVVIRILSALTAQPPGGILATTARGEPARQAVV